MTRLVEIDNRFLLFIQRLRWKPLTPIFLLLTYSGTGRVWFLFAAVVNVVDVSGIHFVESQRNFLRSLFGPLLAWGLGWVLKRVFSRKRPSAEIAGLVQLVPPPGCGSFPSSHAAASFAFFFSLLLVGHPFAMAVGVWAALVSYSRLYLGVHYASDVAGGILLGLASSFGAAWLIGAIGF